MSREILFRGKIADTNIDKWIYGIPIKTHIGTFICYEENPHYCSQYFYMEIQEIAKVIPDTVGQFTGLCDKNDNKIFEGDIVKVIYDDSTEYTTEVRAYGNTLCVDVEGEDYDFTAIDFAADIWRDECCEFEVIGNIYDNPV